MGGHHGGTGMARAEHRRGFPVLDRLGRDANGSQGLPPQRRRCRLGHLDAIGRMKNPDIDAVRTGMPGERVLDHLARADEQQADTLTPGSDQRPADDGVGGMVATHGVDCDSEHGFLALSFQLSALSKTTQSTAVRLRSECSTDG